MKFGNLLSVWLVMWNRKMVSDYSLLMAGDPLSVNAISFTCNDFWRAFFLAKLFRKENIATRNHRFLSVEYPRVIKWNEIKLHELKFESIVQRQGNYNVDFPFRGPPKNLLKVAIFMASQTSALSGLVKFCIVRRDK